LEARVIRALPVCPLKFTEVNWVMEEGIESKSIIEPKNTSAICIWLCTLDYKFRLLSPSGKIYNYELKW